MTGEQEHQTDDRQPTKNTNSCVLEIHSQKGKMICHRDDLYPEKKKRLNL